MAAPESLRTCTISPDKIYGAGCCVAALRRRDATGRTPLTPPPESLRSWSASTSLPPGGRPQIWARVERAPRAHFFCRSRLRSARGTDSQTRRRHGRRARRRAEPATGTRPMAWLCHAAFSEPQAPAAASAALAIGLAAGARSRLRPLRGRGALPQRARAAEPRGRASQGNAPRLIPLSDGRGP